MSSDTNVTQSHEDLLEWHAMELFFVPIMMVIGIVGNLLVGYVYHFRWRSSTVTFVKRILAGLDLASLMLAYPAFLYLTARPNSPNFMSTCVFVGFILLSGAFTSSMVLVIIAVDRYMKLCCLDKIGLGLTRSKKLFAVSLTLGVLVNIPTPWVFGRDVINFHNYDTQAVYCFIADDRNQTAFLAWSAILGMSFMVVTGVLLVLYTMIVRTLRDLSQKHDELKRRPSLATNQETIQKHKQSQVMRSTAKVFIAVTIVFFSSYAPYFVTLILSLTNPTVEGSMGPKLKALYDLAKLSPLVNNVANPIIYSFDSEHFRHEVKKIFTFRTCKRGFFRRRAFSVTNKSYEVSQTSTCT